MNRSSRIHYFDDEGRQHLTQTIKYVKAYLKAQVSHNGEPPRKIVFLTTRGEGPAIAYNELHLYDLQIIAVTFPPRSGRITEEGFIEIQIPEKIRGFFDGVGIKVITSRLPFDSFSSATRVNDDFSLIKSCFSAFGSGMPLVVQCVLQACDHGLIEIGEKVIAVTGDSAVIATASTSALFLDSEKGLFINEVICKPRERTVRLSPKTTSAAQTIEGQATKVRSLSVESPDA